jgi:ribosome-associated protein
MNHTEGTPESKWMLLDYNVVIVHIFHEELRNYYQLEKVWGDAKEINYKGQRTENRRQKK